MARKPILTSLLCSDAKIGRKLNPSTCQTCISPCEYGRDWLRQLGLQPPEERRELNAYLKDTPELKTTFKEIYRRRYKNFCANRL